MTENTSRLSNALADRYQIERRLGEGGMATVYLAEDLKHKRKVAVKVLRPELAAVLGGERFVQEITTTANLQHPHILPLFDSGEADSFLYYVMPFIDGETLRDKLDREKQLGIDEAVKIASEIADALDYAHRHGVIHRDIKPENILLHDGRPMVADFGIALALSAAAGGRMTETGLSLGTPHYMSPEQATAERDVTNRSDIYSLGSMLYEMLTGNPPHVGATAQQIIMKIVTEEAQFLTEVRKSVPPNVAATVAKSLEKLPADRFSSAAEFAAGLANPDLRLPSQAAATRAVARPAAKAGHWLGWAAAMVFASLWAWVATRPEPTRPISRFVISLGQGQDLYDARGTRVAISPDGTQIAFIGPVGGRGQAMIRRRDQLAVREIPSTEEAEHLFFSPDGDYVGVTTRSTLMQVFPLDGGPPLTLADSGVGLDGATWSSDGFIYFDGLTGGGVSGLRRVPARGGSQQVVTTVDTLGGETDHIWPTALPDGRGVLFVIARRGDDPRDFSIGVVDSRTGEYRVLTAGMAALYSASGHLVFLTFDGSLLAAPFDLERLEFTGDAVALLGGVGIRAFGAVDLALSAEGTLLYSTAADASESNELVYVSRDGRMDPIDPGWYGDFRTLAIAPDDRRLVVSIVNNGEEQLWVKELPDGPLTRLTFDGLQNHRANWTPDGLSVTYPSRRGTSFDLFTKLADGTSEPVALLQLTAPVQEAQWSPDGQWLAYRTTPRDILALSPTTGDTVDIVATEFSEHSLAISPDGRWIAYQSNESGRYEIYVRPFPNSSGGKWQISNEGGRFPLWAPDARSLYYRGDDVLIAAEIITSSSFAVGTRRTLFSTAEIAGEEWSYDIETAGERFVMIRRRPGAASSGVIMVESFFEDLRTKVGN